jgi:adenylate kinase
MGRKIKTEVEAGRLVNDDLVVSIVEKKLDRKECKNGFIIDGFKRNVKKEEKLEKIIDKRKKNIDDVIELKIDERIMVRRIKGRMINNQTPTY